MTFSGAIQLGEQGESALVDGGHPMLEDGIDELRLGAEVVADGTRIALAGFSADLAQRDSVYPALGEESLGCLDQPDMRFAAHWSDVNPLGLRAEALLADLYRICIDFVHNRESNSFSNGPEADRSRR